MDEWHEKPRTLLYSEDTIRPYFTRSADEHLAQFTRSIANANTFFRQHSREALTAGKGRPEGLTRALQCYKDETFLTLCAFISLDVGGSPAIPCRASARQVDPFVGREVASTLGWSDPK